MPNSTTVIIPHKRGDAPEWLEEAISSIPPGTPYIVAENDGEYAEALNSAMEAATTEFVFFLGGDDKINYQALDYLESLIWNADVAYPTLVFCTPEMEPITKQEAAPFCPNRLEVWNYVPGTSLVRREKALEVGGFRQISQRTHEDWDLYVRMMRAGARFKPVKEALILARVREGSRSEKVRNKRSPEQMGALWEEIVGEGKRYWATFYPQGTPATAYWRCQLPARALPGVVYDYPAIFNVGTEEQPKLEYPFQFGAAVFQFPGDMAKATMMLDMRDQGVRTMVEVDDNYLQMSTGKNKGWVKKVTSEFDVHSLEVHKLIVRDLCEGIIASTPYLANIYRKVNPNVYVCRNSVDPKDWEPPQKLDDGIIRVGWFASHSHSGDAKLVGPALRWAAEQKGVEVYTMGFNPGWKFKYKYIPWSQDISVYQKALSILDIGLAPIKPDPWSLCRSDSKMLEYSMADVAGIVSGVAPYEEWEHGVNCMKAADKSDFKQQLRTLIENPDLVRELRYNAHEYTMNHRTIHHEREAWLAAVRGD